jgi:hypothetical protein
MIRDVLPDLDLLPILDPGVKRHRIPDPDQQHWFADGSRAEQSASGCREKLKMDFMS